MGKSTKSTLVNGAATISMWQILSNLGKLGERAGFTIDTTIQNEKLVFVIANIPEDKAAALDSGIIGNYLCKTLPC
jgi:hypothetical protein